MGDEYLKACQYGFPMASYYCASQGMTQADMEGLAYLENDIIEVSKKFVPLKNGATIGSSGIETDNVGGAPEKELDELTDSGELTREQQ